ncbi:MAG TPA: CBS domain-containing protein [Candidatus Polarisedimenticolia bacterium]|nr:CBS domain-containing protein [Candidatus Polarisedimenticolia bacterium]
MAFPDELLVEAVERMSRHDVGRLPVVAREDPFRLEGYLGRTGMIAAWTKGLDEETRREHGWLSRRVRITLRKARARRRRAS